MVLDIYIGDVSELLNDERVYESYLSELSEERKNKLKKIKSHSGRCRSAGVGVLLDEALKKYGFREKDMTYGYGEVGKPYFKEAPELYFNLSHSGCKVMCVLGSIPVGCDIEYIKKANAGIAKRFFSAKDNELLEEASEYGEQKYRECFYRLWTLKESYIKCTGQGLKCSMDSFSFVYEDERYHIAGNEDFNFLSDIEILEDGIEEYAYAVCAKKKESPDIKIHRIML